LGLPAGGLTSDQVPHRFVASRFTVDTHMRSLMQRLGAHSRTYALALALRRREIDLGHLR
jgi:DNA-binding CsgD family transcriptional regulator